MFLLRMVLLPLALVLLTIVNTPTVLAQGSIAGSVADAESGDALAGAWVVARPAKGGSHQHARFTRTDEDGNYALENLRAGTYNVTAFSFGYVRQTMAVEVLDDNVTPADFQLEPVMFGSIGGTVTDVDGIGIPNARVIVRPAGDGRSGLTDRFLHARTDEDGNYLIENIRVGDYEVRAVRRGFFDSDWIPATVNNDETTFVDITLEALAFGTVAGNVADASTGDPIEGAWVASGRSHTRTDADGNYTLEDVIVGTRHVRVGARGYQRAFQEVEVFEGDTTIADFALEPRDGGGD